MHIRKESRDAGLARVFAYLHDLPPDTGWRVEIREHKATRSNQQNAYLWAAVYPTILCHSAMQGWDAEDLHEYFLGERFGWEVLQAFGRKRLRPMRRSSRLSKIEFADFIDFIQRKAAALGIVIPDPVAQAA
jgi:hypothetical protein